MSKLLEQLRKKDKRGLFIPTQTSISYSTGFLPLDYRNGYTVQVIDDEENLLESYASIGLRGGTFTTVVGKTGTAKTTFIVQSTYNIVRNFENAFIIYFDLEQVLSYTRVKRLTGATQVELKEKFIIKQEKNYIGDIFDTIIEIAREKEENKKDYKYDTGLKDEFGAPIITYVPTVIVIDSIPTLAIGEVKKKQENNEQMEGSTYANRVAKEIAQFYKKLMPIIKTYNISVMAINHINAKIEINAFAKTQPQVMYLKMDESVPGGNAPLFYANNLFKFVSSDKYKMADDGLDGFLLRVEMLKSRTNKAGQSANLVYDQDRGFDPILSLYSLVDKAGLVSGRNPYRYFKNNPDLKFDSRKFRKKCDENEELKTALLDAAMPILNSYLSGSNTDSDEFITETADNISDYCENVLGNLFDD